MDATTAFSDAPEPLLGAADAVETKAKKIVRMSATIPAMVGRVMR